MDDSRARISITVSGDLIAHVRQVYKLTLTQIAGGHVVRRGINGFSSHALPAYVMSVAAVEAFVNETLMGIPFSPQKVNSVLATLPQSTMAWMERIDIAQKLIVLPQLLFGCTLTISEQPYQDMSILIKLRNDIVHYKMDGRDPPYVRSLEEHGIAIKRHPDETPGLWTQAVSCSEGVRWANNTAGKTARAIVQLMPPGHWRDSAAMMADNFHFIDDQMARRSLNEYGIDPDTDHPSQ